MLTPTSTIKRCCRVTWKLGKLAITSVIIMRMGTGYLWGGFLLPFCR
jgi:hypothetical protein